VRSGGDVLAYAKALSYLEERRAAFPEFVLGANGGVLTMRIKRLLGYKEDAQASQFATFALLALMIVGAGSYAVSAGAQPKTASALNASLTVQPVGRMAQPAAGSEAATANEALVASTLEPAGLGGESQGVDSRPAASAKAGAISGVIIDPTGALVPRATVRASNAEMHVSMAKVTDNTGSYSLSPLPPGRYDIEVAAPGFQRLLQDNVQVGGNQKLALNLKLKVGPVDQALTVEGTPVTAPQPPPVVAPTARPDGRPLRVSAGVVAGLATVMVPPVYPEEAKADSAECSAIGTLAAGACSVESQRERPGSCIAGGARWKPDFEG
jgi:hypothetical protein